MGEMVESDGHHLVGGRHFKIKGQGNFLFEPGDIVVADMAAVLAKMGGDAVASGLRHHPRRPQRGWRLAAARITQGRHMIDIDAEAQFAFRCRGHGFDSRRFFSIL
jgi:hypothetical protein